MSRLLFNRVSRRACSSLFLCGLASAAAAVQAGPITVLNPSFEQTPVGDGNAPNGSIPDWNQTGTGGVWNPQDAAFPNSSDTDIGGGVLPAPADGNQVLYINGGIVYQVIGPLLANTTYTLTAAVGASLGGNSGPPTIELENAIGLGGSVLNSLLTSLPTPGTIQDFSVSATTGSSVTGNLVIIFNPNAGQAVLDNIRLDGVTAPEPGSLVLLGCGAIGLAAWVRRHRAGQQTV